MVVANLNRKMETKAPAQKYYGGSKATTISHKATVILIFQYNNSPFSYIQSPEVKTSPQSCIRALDFFTTRTISASLPLVFNLTSSPFSDKTSTSISNSSPQVMADSEPPLKQPRIGHSSSLIEVEPAEQASAKALPSTTKVC
jgi:hypothetical protein